MLFAPATPTRALDYDSFAAALSIQLETRGLKLARSRWRGHAPRRFDAALDARLRGAGAGYAVGYSLDAAGDVSVWVADRQRRTLHRFGMGEPTPGFERTIASTVRTVLLAPAAPGAADGAPRDAGTRHGAATAPASTSAAAATGVSAASLARRVEIGAPPRLALGIDYRVSAYPSVSDVRHGPDFWASLRVWRRLELVATVGLRAAPDRQARGLSLSRRFLHLRLDTRWVFRPHPRVALDVGAGGRLGLGDARGQVGPGAPQRPAPAPGALSSGRLVELAVGLQAGVRWRLTSRVDLALRGHLGMLTKGHVVEVGGEELARGEGLEAGVSLGIHFGVL